MAVVVKLTVVHSKDEQLRRYKNRELKQPKSSASE